MANELKEFTELLLSNLQGLSNKVDILQIDVSGVKSDVAVLKETQKTVDKLNTTIETFHEKMGTLDKELAIKTSKLSIVSSLVTSLVTLLVALLIAALVGVFDRPQAQGYPHDPYGRNSIVDTTLNR